MFKKLLFYLIDYTDESPLNKRIFNSLMFVGAATSVFSSMSDVILGLNISVFYFSLSMAVVFSVFYILTRYVMSYEKLIIPSVLVFYLIVFYSWIFIGGIDGTSTYFVFMTMIYISVMLKSKSRIIMMLLLMIQVSVLFYVEFRLPHLIVAYPHELLRFQDVFATMMVLLIVGSISVSFIMGSYYYEHQKGETTNALLVELNAELHHKNTELEKALGEVDTLSGLLPICSCCSKIRDSKGYWQKLETYLSAHSAAKFSHSLCCDCYKDLYGKEQWYDESLCKEDTE